ncbi:MAG: flavin reductase family protein [Nannocystaceae bacterium]|nr:flavin reductase family protein [bacterium]
MQHEHIDPSGLGGRDVYRLMTDLVAPRPIAWVSTLSAEGSPNLAPFSYFQAMGSKPPTVVIGCGWTRAGAPKDTLRNILDTREFTISHVSEPVAEAMNLTSVELPPGDSEWDHVASALPLSSTPAQVVGPARVSEARASMECRMVQAIPVGRTAAGSPASTIVIGEVVAFTVAEGLVRRDESGHFLPMDPAELQSVGRLGGIAYTRTADASFELVRPKPPTQ